jgi:ribosome-associated translation inhibitor RaiA/cold shock CspA family protein
VDGFITCPSRDDTKPERTMKRPLQIAFKNVESSASLETLIRERVERLQRFHPHITGARVVVEVPHRSPESGKLPLGIAVEIDVPGRNPVIAKGEQDRREVKGDRSAIVNRVFEAAERQLEQIAAIRKGEVKQHGSAGDTGVVVRIFPEQNYGFIEVKDSPDLYFSREVVGNGSFEHITVGSLVHVTRAATEGPMGPQASSVKLMGARS